MNILQEYDDVLIGNKKYVSKTFFQYGELGNERVALTVFRYAIEKLLRWSPEEAQKFFNYDTAKLMKLAPLYKYIRLPSDVFPEDTEYILYLLYPDKVRYDIAKYAIRIYEKVVSGEMRYPKDYMYGYIGMLRARICFQYSLKRNGKVFETDEDYYDFFSSKEGDRYIRDNCLIQLYKGFYSTPVEYAHASLPKKDRSMFLLQNGILMYELRTRFPEIYAKYCRKRRN